MADLVATDDQNRQAIVSRFFHFVGDLTSGMDSSPRLDPGWVRADGTLGAAQSTDVALGADGQVYVRGKVAINPAVAAPATGTAAPAGLVLSPTLLILAALAFFALRR